MIWLLLLMQDPGSGRDPAPLPSGPRSQWRVGSGLDKRFGFYSIAVHASFLWVPHLELDEEPYLDKNFACTGGVAQGDFGPIRGSIALYGGSFTGSVRGGLEMDGDLLVVRAGAYLPVIEFIHHFWNLSIGPTAGFIGLFEEVEAIGGMPVDEFLDEYGATLGAKVSIDYVFGKTFFFTLQAGASYVTVGGWMPEIAFGFGVNF